MERSFTLGAALLLLVSCQEKPPEPDVKPGTETMDPAPRTDGQTPPPIGQQ